jgi:hypothetical protein
MSGHCGKWIPTVLRGTIIQLSDKFVMPLVAKYTKTNLRTIQIHCLRTSNLRDHPNTGQTKAHWLSEEAYK